MKYLRHTDGIKKLGDRIRAIRLSKNISQEDLAYKANVEFSQISRIERGIINTSISHAFVIAEALGVSMKYLFDFENEI